MFESKRSPEYKRAREEHKKAASKDRLTKIGQQKIKTTMIGALATIEEKLGYLWEHDPKMQNVYDEIRSEILDKGNNQIRNFEVELAQYDIIWNQYTMILPVKRKEQ